MIALDKKLVKKMADLAMLELSVDEIEKYEKELEKILEYVEKIKSVDTENVEYKSHIDLKNVMREDEAIPGMDQQIAVTQAKNKKGYIVVPNVI